MPIKTLNIFISSRFGEFSEIRKHIAQKQFLGLSELGLTITMLDYKEGIADARSPGIASMEEAKNSDVYILLLGETYSSHIQTDLKSYTHQEYDTALDKCLRILAFPVGDSYNPDNEVLSDNLIFREWQETVLRNEVHITAPFTPSNYKIDELYEKIYNSLRETIRQIFYKQLHFDEECPYDVRRLYSQYNDILHFVSKSLNEENDGKYTNLLLTEKNQGEDVPLPVILLTREEIRISNHISQIEDTNKVNEYFLNILKKQCGKNLWNNPTFRLIDINQGTLTLGLSDYFKTISTCDIHYYRFMNKNYQMTPDSPHFNTWFTLLKKIAHHMDFRDISASIGGSTLLVMKNYLTHKYQYYIVNNSNTKNGNGTKHVIPSFMFQPTKVSTDESDLLIQSDIFLQVLKEFAEELLGMEELEHINDYQKLYYTMMGNPLLKKLKSLIDSGKATFKTLGIALDIFRLRPEILSVLIIDDEEFFEQFNIQRTLSWEASTDDMDGLQIINLEDQKKYLDLMLNTKEPLVPPALACLKLGREYALKYVFGTKQ